MSTDVAQELGLTTAGSNMNRGRLARSADGFRPFRDRKVDVLLLQEIDDLSSPYEPQMASLRQRLEADGYKMVHSFGELAIAVAEDSGWQVKAKYTEPLQRMGRFARVMSRLAPNAFHERKFRRDAIGVTLESNDRFVTVIDTHLTTAVHAIERYRQARVLGGVVNKIRAQAARMFGKQQVVLEGDLNHFPEEGIAEWQMRRIANVERVNFGRRSTYVRGDLMRHFYLYLWPSIIRLDGKYYSGGIRPKKTEVVGVDSDHKSLITEWEWEEE
jgi:endonuclease/exonuclease/phosphatase family metal-dependent hydrolase